jgi:hypothetical protein
MQQGSVSDFITGEYRGYAKSYGSSIRESPGCPFISCHLQDGTISLSLSFNAHTAFVHGEDESQIFEICPALSGSVNEQFDDILRFIDIGMQPERVYDIDRQAGFLCYLHVL